MSPVIAPNGQIEEASPATFEANIGARLPEPYRSWILRTGGGALQCAQRHAATRPERRTCAEFVVEPREGVIMVDGRVRIRPVADLEQLAVVERLMARELDDWAGSWRGPGFFRSRFPADADLMLIAEHEGNVIGGILAHAEPSGASIDGVAVDRGRRREGVGRALLGSMEAQAGARGIEEIALGAGDDAVGFYRRCGYRASLLIQFEPATADPERHIRDLLAGRLTGRDIHRTQFRGTAQLIVEVDAEDDPVFALLREQAPEAHTSFLLRKRLPRPGMRA